MTFSSELTFFLNGSKVILPNVQPETTLLQYVRSVGLCFDSVPFFTLYVYFLFILRFDGHKIGLW